MRINIVILAATLVSLLVGSLFSSDTHGDAEPVTARAGWHIGSSRLAP